MASESFWRKGARLRLRRMSRGDLSIYGFRHAPLWPAHHGKVALFEVPPKSEFAASGHSRPPLARPVKKRFPLPLSPLKTPLTAYPFRKESLRGETLKRGTFFRATVPARPFGFPGTPLKGLAQGQASWEGGKHSGERGTNGKRGRVSIRAGGLNRFWGFSGGRVFGGNKQIVEFRHFGSFGLIACARGDSP